MDWIKKINEDITRHRTVIPRKTDRWFEDYAFLISYGVDGKIIPVGDIVTYQQFGKDSLSIQEFIKLSDEAQKEAMEAVFSNEKGDLELRISVGRLMELRDMLKECATEELVDNEEISSLPSLPLDDMGATIESINGNSTRTLLGNNYSIYPFKIRNDYARTREIDTSNDLER